MIILAVVLTFIGTVAGVAVLLALLIPAPNPHLVKLQQIGAAPGSAERAKATAARWLSGVGSLVQRAAERLGQSLPFLNPKAQAKRRNLLIQAGYRKGGALVTFQGYRIMLAMLLPGAYLLAAPYLKGWNGGVRLLAVASAFAAIGLLLPQWWLLQRIKQRHEEVSMALPHALDLMVVCAEAGLGLDATIQRLAQAQQFTKHVLSEELQIVSQEMRAGRPRAEALTALKERVGLTELSAVIIVLVQAERTGTSIARALRVHADSFRTKRRQRAEERAAKIPVKMVFPLVLLIFPAMLLVVLGPAYISLYKAFAVMKR